jgi:PHP family Zn ribbon phosphoesterase
MDLNLDLHSHSGYAGGVGNTSFEDIERNMPRKGIHVVGTGDCIHPAWRKELENMLHDDGTGLYSYREESTVSYLLQTEVIVTSDIGGRRKGVHTLLFFPSFDAIDAVVQLLGDWGVKNTVGRPFIKCLDACDVSNRMGKLLDVDDGIEVVPAHVMTPEGVLGSKAPVSSMHEFFGDAVERLSIIETGLSADPYILSLVPELDRFTFISNSDAHSPALNRMGREFTTVSSARSYDGILSCLRKNRIEATAEFNPMEGRYFLTGHRGSRKGHDGHYCVYGPGRMPPDGLCPICGKPLTIGVLERALQLSHVQGDPRNAHDMSSQTSVTHMVPLVEVIASAKSIGSLTSKKVLDVYDAITNVTNECEIWLNSLSWVESRLSGVVGDDVLSAIRAVKEENFCFDPAGYDGEYGALVIGEKKDVSGLCICT